jgi:hypothetical protein
MPNIAGFTPIHLLVPLTIFSLVQAFRFLARGDIAAHARTMRLLYLGACVVAGLFTLLPQRYLGRLLWGTLAPLAPIAQNTPPWVWGLLAGLVVLGWMQSRDRTASLGAVTGLPVGMALFGLWGSVSAFGRSPLVAEALVLWLIAFGAATALLARRPATAWYDRGTRTFDLAGSWTPLALFLAVFLTRLRRLRAARAAPAAGGGARLRPAGGGALRCLQRRLHRPRRAAVAAGAAPATVPGPPPEQEKPMRNARLLASLALAACSLAAQAGTGLATLPGVDGDGPVTVFHPTAQAERPVQRGPFTLSLAEQAPPTRGNGRLVVVSHGSGGNPWVHADLARVLVDAGFVVAVPRHHGDHSLDHSDPAPTAGSCGRVKSHAPSMRSPGRRRSRAAVAGPRGRVRHVRRRPHGARDGRRPLVPRAVRAPLRSAHRRRLRGLRRRVRGPERQCLDGLKKTAACWCCGTASPTRPGTRTRTSACRPWWPACRWRPTSMRPRSRNRACRWRSSPPGSDKWLVPRFHSATILAACAPRCTLLADLPDGGHGALLSPAPPSNASTRSRPTCWPIPPASIAPSFRGGSQHRRLLPPTPAPLK